MPQIVYLSIGNSDDKLTQREWSAFTLDVASQVAGYADTIHGTWFSSSSAPWQNACWCLEFSDPEKCQAAREAVTQVRKAYRQESAAWAIAETEFI